MTHRAHLPCLAGGWQARRALESALSFALDLRLTHKRKRPHAACVTGLLCCLHVICLRSCDSPSPTDSLALSLCVSRMRRGGSMRPWFLAGRFERNVKRMRMKFWHRCLPSQICAVRVGG